MNKWKGFLFVISLLFSSWACLLGGSGEAQSTPDLSVLKTSVAKTLIAQDDFAPTRTPEIVECTPPHPGEQDIDLPVGFTAGVDNSTIRFYDLDGNLMGEKLTPGLKRIDQSQIHIAGGISNGIAGAPLIYTSLDSGGVIKGNIGSEIFEMDSPGEIVTISGAGGVFTLIAYSTAEFTDEGYITALKTGEMGDLASINPQLERKEDDGLVYYPLSIHGEEGQNRGTWFTYLKYKVSDFVFVPYHGLFYYDLTQNQVTEYLPADHRLKGFSPDQSLVAFGDAPGANPEENETGIIFKNLVDCHIWGKRYHDSSTNGGGEVVFSPDNKYVAWIESSGFTLEELEWRLRVLNLDHSQTYIIDSELNALTGLTGGEIPSSISTVGWLSNHVLLLQIRVPSNDAPLLVAFFAPDPDPDLPLAPDLPLDPDLESNQPVLLAEGEFSGFLYP